MKNKRIMIIIVAVLILNLILSYHQISWAVNSYNDRDSLKVLFIGNSLTFYNDQPEMFRSLALAANHDIFVDEMTIGSASLNYHSTNQETIDKIYSQNWDYVILQGTSYYIAFPEQHSFIRPSIMLLDSLIHDNYESTKVVLFMRFAKPEGLTWNQEFYDYNTMQDLIYEGCMLFTSQTDLIVAPAGLAWKQVLNERDDIELNYYNDQTHPSYEGSYLDACVYFSLIFQENLDNNSYYSILSPDIGRYLQSVASQLVLYNLEHWNIIQVPDYADGMGVRLYQNYPNPFNQKTHITFETEINDVVSLQIFNLNGQWIKTLLNDYLYSGFHSIEWDGKDENNISLSSGIYYYKLRTRNYQKTKKMIMVN